MKREVISVLVQNHAGVLARVSSLFARRGFNIDSLTVSATNDPAISRITVVVHDDEKVLDHVNGSWFHQLDQNNNVIGTVWPGKSDLYHALQATLIPYHAAALSIAPAVKEGKEI